MLAYVYGVVPISLCRGGGCGVSTANGKGVKIEFDEDDGPITGKVISLHSFITTRKTGRLCLAAGPDPFGGSDHDGGESAVLGGRYSLSPTPLPPAQIFPEHLVHLSCMFRLLLQCWKDSNAFRNLLALQLLPPSSVLEEGGHQSSSLTLGLS